MSTDVVLREEKKKDCELPALYYLIKDAVLLSRSHSAFGENWEKVKEPEKFPAEYLNNSHVPSFT